MNTRKLAEKIVDAIERDIKDRSGFGDDWEDTCESVKEEIRESWRKLADDLINDAYDELRQR